jgi:DNA-directed RNA polymerase specialized sigma24 family protein
MFKPVMKHLSMENASIGVALARMVHSTTSHPCLRDDLLQEALVHAWLIEERRPGQTRSWYLQSCKFHLRHYLDSGRSIDSQKRRTGQLPSADDVDGYDELLDQIDPGESVFACVSARDIISLLSRHLPPPEKAVLDCLAEGLGTREIGRKLKVSHTLVIQRRRKIASLLTRLEAPSFPLFQRNQTNGLNHLNGSERINGAKPVNGFGPSNGTRLLVETQESQKQSVSVGQQ